MAHDLRHAVRSLRRAPGTTAVVLLTLALGIGVNSAIFSFVDAVLLKPLPYPNAGRMVAIWERRPSGQANAITTLNYLDFARQSTVFEHIAATTACCGSTWLTPNDGSPTPLPMIKVSASYFDIFGAAAAHGRTFRPGDDEPGHDRVVVLAHKAWATHFGSDPALVGRTIQIDREPHTVIGIMPPDTPFDRSFFEGWLPLRFERERMNRSSHWLLSPSGGAIGLLKPGVTIETARAELGAIAGRLSAAYPESNKDWGVVALPYADTIVGKDLRQSLYLLLAAVGMVLVVACVNVANVTLGRALAREREIAVRLAIGAGPGRLVRQFLTESLLISLTGGLAGVAVAYGTIIVLKRVLESLPLTMATLPMMLPAEATIGVDARVLMFTAATSVACGVAFGLAPAIAFVRRPPAALVGASRTSTPSGHGRLRAALVVTEVTLAFVLLANAGLLIRSFANMQRADTGFDTGHVVGVELPVREHRFADAVEQRAFMHQVMANVAAVPGVSGVAFSDAMPMRGGPNGTFVQLADAPVIERAQRPVVDLRVVSPSYFHVLSLRLRRGRALSELDREHAPLVTVINETMARRFFGDDNPIGRQLLMDRPAFGATSYAGDAAFDIVGVVADERVSAFADPREHAAVYVSYEQQPDGFAGIVVRTGMDAGRIERALRTAIAAVDKNQPVQHVLPAVAFKAETMIADRIRSALLFTFAAMAVALAAIGIYGVISYSVVQRTREIGIRAALGASPRNLIRLVIGRSFGLTAAGLGIGFVASQQVARLLRSFLYGVGPADPVAAMGTIAALAAVAAIACCAPARRAIRIDPMTALREE